jgi:hypothetical protein
MNYYQENETSYGPTEPEEGSNIVRITLNGHGPLRPIHRRDASGHADDYVHSSQVDLGTMGETDDLGSDEDPDDESNGIAAHKYQLGLQTNTAPPDDAGESNDAGEYESDSYYSNEPRHGDEDVDSETYTVIPDDANEFNDAGESDADSDPSDDSSDEDEEDDSDYTATALDLANLANKAFDAQRKANDIIVKLRGVAAAARVEHEREREYAEVSGTDTIMGPWNEAEAADEKAEIAFKKQQKAFELLRLIDNVRMGELCYTKYTYLGVNRRVDKLLGEIATLEDGVDV